MRELSAAIKKATKTNDYENLPLLQPQGMNSFTPLPAIRSFHGFAPHQLRHLVSEIYHHQRSPLVEG